MKKQEIVLINIKDITPLENSRSSIEKEPLKELADSIKTNGLKQPVLLRKKGSKYELIFGRRRFEAHKLLKEDKIKAIVEDVKDEDIVKLQIIENLQREDLTEYDEMLAIHKYYKQDSLTIKTIAEYLGKTMQYVHLRIKGADAYGPLRELFKKGQATAVAFFEVAKYPLHVQKYVFDNEKWLLNREDIKDIRNRLKDELPLSKAPFDIKFDFPAVKNCLVCPKRSSVAKELFPEYSKEDSCLDEKCYDEKCVMHTENVISALHKAGKEFVIVKTTYGTPPKMNLQGKDVIDPDKFSKSKSGIPAVVVLPRAEAGKVIKVNLIKKSDKKVPASTQATAKDSIEAARKRLQSRFDLALARKFSEVVEKVADHIYKAEWPLEKFLTPASLTPLFLDSVFGIAQIVSTSQEQVIEHFTKMNLPNEWETEKYAKFMKDLTFDKKVKYIVTASLVRGHMYGTDVLGDFSRGDKNILSKYQELYKTLGLKGLDFVKMKTDAVLQVKSEFDKAVVNHNAKWKDKMTSDKLFDVKNKESDQAYT